MEKYRVCNAGCCAGIATYHLEGFKNSGRAEIVGVCDINEEEGKKIAEKYGAKFYPDFDEMIEKEDFDILDITTPDNFHFQQIIAGIKKGVHILCEKPLVIRLKELDEIKKGVKKNNVFVMPSHMMRWKWQNIKAKELIKNGKIGKPVFGRYIYKGTFYNYPENSFYRKKESYGQFLHNGIHFVDLMCFLMGSLPESIYGLSTEYYENHKLETPNYYHVSYLMKNKSLLEIEYNQLLRWRKGPEVEIFIVGTEGNLLISEENKAVKISNIDGEYYPEDISSAFYLEINHFLDVIEKKAKPVLPFDETLKIMEAVILTVNKLLKK